MPKDINYQPPFDPARSPLQDMVNMFGFVVERLKQCQEQEQKEPELTWALIALQMPLEEGEDPDDRMTVIKANEAALSPELLKELGGDVDETLYSHNIKIEDMLARISEMVTSPDAVKAPAIVIQRLREILNED